MSTQGGRIDNGVEIQNNVNVYHDVTVEDSDKLPRDFNESRTLLFYLFLAL